jgi:hypothetical protein
MSTVSASDLFILVTYSQYDGISGDTENIYTDKAEAEAKAAEMSKVIPGTTMSIKYHVLTLDDYIDEIKTEYRQLGRQDERGDY